MKQRPIPLKVLFVTSLLVCLVAQSGPAAATTCTWSGAVSNLWNVAGNWDALPVAGDDLVFPDIASNKFLCTNNFAAGTSFNSITFTGGGYNLGGNAITLINGLTNNGSTGNSVGLDITLSGPQTFTNTGSALSLNGIQLGSHTLTFMGGTNIGIYGPITGSGGITQNGTGTIYLLAACTYSGPTSINKGGILSGIANGLSLLSAVTVASGAQLILSNNNNTIASLAGDGTVNLGSGNLGIAGSSSTTFNGQITGTGGLTIGGMTATLRLTGNGYSYTGATDILGGTLLVDGTLTTSPIHATATGVLGGTGTVGTVTAGAGGTISPGVGGPGMLTCGSLTMGAATLFSVQLNGGTAGTGYDQIVANGPVGLTEGIGNCNLNVTLGFVPAPGQQFTIINNLGGAPINSTFNGLAEGAALTIGGTPFTISYVGGTGNDVVLTASQQQVAGVIAVPTMTEWGMIGLIILIGLVSAYHLRRLRRI